MSQEIDKRNQYRVDTHIDSQRRRSMLGGVSYLVGGLGLGLFLSAIAVPAAAAAGVLGGGMLAAGVITYVSSKIRGYVMNKKFEKGSEIIKEAKSTLTKAKSTYGQYSGRFPDDPSQEEALAEETLKQEGKEALPKQYGKTLNNFKDVYDVFIQNKKNLGMWVDRDPKERNDDKLAEMRQNIDSFELRNFPEQVAAREAEAAQKAAKNKKSAAPAGP